LTENLVSIVGSDARTGSMAPHQNAVRGFRVFCAPHGADIWTNGQMIIPYLLHSLLRRIQEWMAMI
jgi:hypothetical protein